MFRSVCLGKGSEETGVYLKGVINGWETGANLMESRGDSCES